MGIGWIGDIVSRLFGSAPFVAPTVSYARTVLVRLGTSSTLTVRRGVDDEVLVRTGVAATIQVGGDV